MTRHAAIAAAAVLTLSSLAAAQAAALAPAAEPKPAAPPPPTPAAREAAARQAAEVEVLIERQAQLEAAKAQADLAVQAEREARDQARRAQAQRVRVIAPDGAAGGADHFFVTTAVAAQRMEKCAFLGVNASPAPAPLREQLKLAKNTGLVVDQVVPDSPAAAAGLQQHDVVVRLNDQILVNAAQFVVLVRTYKPNDEVTLSIVRQNKPAELKVKLVEREMPVLDEQQLNGGGGINHAWPQPVVAPFDAAVVANVAGNVIDLHPSPVLGLAGDVAVIGDGGGGGGLIGIAPPADAADGAPANPVLRGRRVIRAGNEKMVIKDNDFIVEVEGRNGERVAKVLDAKTGKPIVEGPVKSPDVRKAMPAKAIEQLELMDAQVAAADRGVMFLTKAAARRSQEINWSDGEKDFHIFAKEDGGKRETRLVVKDIAGRVIFEGPIDTADQRKQLPDDIAEKLTQALLANVPVKP